MENSKSETSKKSKVTKQRIAYMNQFNKQNYDRIELIVPKGHKEQLRAIAKEKGMSMNELFNKAIQDWCKQNGIDLQEN